MVVRAKRLVWEQDGPGTWSADCPFGKFRITEYPRGIFSVYQGREKVGDAISLDLAKQLEQMYFDRLWVEATEVPDLLWTSSELDNRAEILISGRYHISRTGTAFDKWEAQFDYETIAGDLDSQEAAQHACNAHNRDYILGSPAATEGAA